MKPGVLILAGGRATRLPGKLETQTPSGKLLVTQVYENVRDAGPVVVSSHGGFSTRLDLDLQCALVIDRLDSRGPLGGVVTALKCMPATLVCIIAGDAPFITSATLSELRSHWQPGLEAVVPVNASGRLEPLCALYARVPMLEAANAALRLGSGAVVAAVELLHIKRVRLADERAFLNVNTPGDRRTLLNLE